MGVTGYSTTTYKMKLYCKRLDWLIETKRLYNEVEEFYHDLFFEHTELWELSSQNALRELEKLTLADRSGNPPKVKLPFENIPVYFRRSAINTALAVAHIYITKEKNYMTEKAKHEAENKEFKIQRPTKARTLNSSPIFYKYMYKDFDGGVITLKLWTGSSWAWVKCKYTGRDIPANAEVMSPTVVIRKNKVSLHVPVKVENTDARTVKERMADNENVCGVNFTNYDAFAVCCAYAADGSAIASRFIRGGNEYVHHSKRLYERINSNRKVMGKHFDWTGANRKYWTHINNLSEYWAHKVSREIINFCKENNVKTISIAKSDDKIIGFTIKRTTKYTPIYLSMRIFKYLEYKAWQAGIVVTEVRPNYTSNKCTLCRSYIVKTQSYEKTYRCKNGHTGNKDLNTAKNIGKMALKKFGKLPA